MWWVMVVLAQTPESLPELEETSAPVGLGDRVFQMIEQAIGIRQQGDLDSSERILRELESIVPPDLQSWYWYQRGICAELMLRPEEALAFYMRAIEGDKAASISAGGDARLRRAYVLEGQGRDREALEEVRVLAGLGDWSEADEATVMIQQGILEVNSGFLRKGVRHMESGLAALEGTNIQTWVRAKARYTLAKLLYSEAMGLSLSGSDRQAARRFKKRAELMNAAENQVLAVIALNEVEWVLACLVALGDAYLDWGIDLSAAQPPRKFTEAEQVIWQEEIGKYSDNARQRAIHTWEKGVELAARLEFESPRVAELKKRLAEHQE